MRIFNLFFTIIFLPIVLILSIFSKKIRAGAKFKFGNYDFDFSDCKNILWIHAVSVGEVQVASQIIEKLKGYEIVLTTSTPQGQALAMEKLGAVCKKITYFPYDFHFAVKNAIRAINPSAVMIVETEIWAELASQLKAKNIPLMIVNARISDSTYKSYRLLKFFFKNVFKNYFAILAQSEADATRFVNIGADKNIVRTIGNIKFDIEKPQNINFDLKAGEKPLIVAGSTHKGEDEIIYKTYKKLRAKYVNLKLLIAPRHLERVNYIQKLTGAGLRSKSDFLARDILILDTTGELKDAYSIATIAILCGSFDNTGGHNPLEATVHGVPVVTGKNVKNFKQIYRELCALNCAKIVKNQEELEELLLGMLKNRKIYYDMKKNCVEVLNNNKGALNLLVQFIDKELKNESQI